MFIKSDLNPYLLEYLLEKCSAREIACILDQCSRDHTKRKIPVHFRQLRFHFHNHPADTTKPMSGYINWALLGRQALEIVLIMMVHKRDNLGVPIRLHDIDHNITIKGIIALLRDSTISSDIRVAAEKHLFDIPFISLALNTMRDSGNSPIVDEKVNFAIGPIREALETINAEYTYSRVRLASLLFKFKMWLSSIVIIQISNIRRSKI